MNDGTRSRYERLERLKVEADRWLACLAGGNNTATEVSAASQGIRELIERAAGFAASESVPTNGVPTLKAREVIIENCAQICEAQGRKAPSLDGQSFYIAIGQCAAAIRKLKDDKWK